LEVLDREILELKELRKIKSAALQEEIFRNFSFLNGKGERKDMLDIFSEFYREQSLREGRAILPPGGAGECAAPKLLQYAFSHGMRPISMGEFWWGDSPRGEIRRHGEFYPSCKGKCAPILGFMLQGLPVGKELLHTSYGCAGELETLYSDDYIVAVNKPAGMASVPGKEVSGSVLCSAEVEYPVDESSNTGPVGLNTLFVVHRLDMHTSGVLLLAKDEQVYKELQSQFAGRSVRKCYVAVLEGEVHPQNCGSGVHWESATSGTISLPLAADYDHRPAQKVDFETGKEAVTLFEIIGVKGGRTYINFYPVTGRTHQLRVHSAHQMGLNTPIVGDLLYGKAEQRLMLHAHWVEFQHPFKGDFKIVSPLPDGFSL
jgi:tRNA pseudouridine32 synthase/23S rRNA pseudouridine746 synthase